MERSKAPMRRPEAGGVVEGVLQLKGRVGFVLSEKENVPDVLIQGHSLRLARDGDRVRARLLPLRGADRQAGEITAVLIRARTTAAGIFRRIKGVPYLLPEDESGRIRLNDPKGLAPDEGLLVAAEITRWPSRSEEAGGDLVEVLGPADSPGAELLAVIRRHELPDQFTSAAAAEAASFGEEVSSESLSGRTLFFDQTVVTIDGEDAADFDDAISIEARPGGGWTLGVHIADVSHYVKEGGALDKDAFRRGTSVYFPGTVVPMLPFSLSSNLCSLRPNVVRLTLSCVMEISPEGHVRSCDLVESAIRSARRFTYNEVEAVLKGDAVPNVSKKLASDLEEMDRLARLVRRRRVERGSLDFDFPEPDVTMDPHGRPVDIQKRERLESHRLIEDFMVLANESVARFMSNGPFLYRVHETPDQAKVENLKKTLDAVGLSLPNRANPADPKTFQRVIGLLEGRPVQPIVQMMILRSLKQAIYSPVNKGHFGLASACYAHFTSPIRRYPDLIVHRIVRERLHNRLTGDRKEFWNEELKRVATHTSTRERVAVTAERDYTGLQKVKFMAGRVGESFSATISGIAAFGFFVRLNEVFVEGMVPVATLDDYYEYDEVRMRLVGRRTSRRLWIGQKVDVRLAAANAVKRQLEFQLLAAEGHPERSGPPAKQGGAGSAAPSQPGGPRPGNRRRRGPRHRRSHPPKPA